MKIRHGFVSNSSSSSFCLFGTYQNGDSTLVKTLRKLIIEKFKIEFEEDEDEYIDDFECCANEVTSLYTFCDDDCYYIGLDYTSMKMDETRREFETRVLKEIQKLDPSIKELHFYNESVYD